MIKRLFDITIAMVLLVLSSPIIGFAALLVWLQDFHSPFYVAIRYGKDKHPFKMLKLRSMIVHQNVAKVDTTAKDDPRITRLGHLIRKAKIDELPQLINVIKGEMSLVGPRPNVEREVALYTAKENELFKARPGITDLASIVFSDLAEIAAAYQDPNLAYGQLVRPWKNRLALLYVERQTLWVDVCVIVLTVVSLFSREKALQGVAMLVKKMGGSEQLQQIALRQKKLEPYPILGTDEVFTSRHSVR